MSRRETRTEQVIAAIIATTIFWFCTFMIVQPCKAEWKSGQELPLPVDFVNPYVYVMANNNPSPMPNTDASLAISGWSNLYYHIILEDAEVKRSRVLKSYYREGKPECHEFTIRFTFVPKRGTIVTVDRVGAAYPPQFDDTDPDVIQIRISQFSSRQAQLTKLIKTMDTVTVQLIDCNENVETGWVFDLSGATVALQEIEK